MTTFTLLHLANQGCWITDVVDKILKRAIVVFFWGGEGGGRCHDSFSTLLFFFLPSFFLSLLFFIVTFGTLTAGLKPNEDQ